jgi:hypothetical protein
LFTVTCAHGKRSELVDQAGVLTDLTLDCPEICGPPASAGLRTRLELVVDRVRPSVERVHPPDAESRWAVRALPSRRVQTQPLYYLNDRASEGMALILRCFEATAPMNLQRKPPVLAKRHGWKGDRS